MEKPVADPLRSGVKATFMWFTEPPMYYQDDRLHGPLGAFVGRKPTETDWLLCCPGCGEMGSPKDGARWRIVRGSFDDVGSLTLMPSIAKSCCGWHGYLVDGIFQLTPPS